MDKITHSSSLPSAKGRVNARAQISEKTGLDSSSAATRTRLIETAARHFAEFGFQAASLRAIQREVGVNPASVHYHFGSKRAVYNAIMDSYLSRIQEDRQQRFAAIDAKLKGGDRLRALITAYVAPHLEVVAGEHGEAYGRLMARGVIEPHASGPDVVTVLQPLREQFLAELGKLFPDVGRAMIARCLSFAIILMTTVPFDRSYASMTGRKPIAESAKIWIDIVVTYSAAGFLASCGELVD